MFDFDKRELVILAVALTVAVVFGVWAAFGIAETSAFFIRVNPPVRRDLNLSNSRLKWC